MAGPQMKPREFWIKQCYYNPDRAVSSYELAICRSGCTNTPIHVRECVPIDWEKVYNDYCMQTKKNDDFKLIQQLVEAQLKGEE